MWLRKYSQNNMFYPLHPLFLSTTSQLPVKNLKLILPTSLCSYKLLNAWLSQNLTKN